MLSTVWLALVRSAVGRRSLTLPTTAGPVQLRVASLTAGSAGSLLAPGRVRDVRLEATEVRWSGLEVPRVHVHADAVELRLVGALTTAGLTVDATVPTAVLQALLDRAGRPTLLLELADGTPVLRWSRVRRAVALEVRPEVVDARLALRAVALRLRRRRWRLPSRLPPLSGAGVRLPSGFELRSVEPVADGVAVRLHRA